jgi:hypothetical protein
MHISFDKMKHALSMIGWDVVEIDLLSDPDGIMAIFASGQWELVDVDLLYRNLRIELSRRRAHGRPIRILFDITEALRPSEAVAARTLWQMQRTFQPSDRVAILTNDIDQKKRLRLLLESTNVAVFSSKLPSEMWLTSDIDRPY